MPIEGTHQGVHTKVSVELGDSSLARRVAAPGRRASENCAIELRGDTVRSREMKIWVEMLIHTPEHLLITWQHWGSTLSITNHSY